MKLLIVLITYQRLEYTQRTLKSLGKTLDIPATIMIVDNNSTDGTQEFIKSLALKPIHWGFPAGFMHVILNPENYYPGKACNIGWAEGLKYLPDATHLMRCDNDMDFEPNWASKAQQYFEAMPILGQLGLDDSALDSFKGDERYITTINGKSVNAWPGNVGGPCIISREVYDRGARYDETPWQDLRETKDSMITPQEDVKFSLFMHKYGYIYGHPTEKLASTFANESNRSQFAEYYKKTFSERGYEI